MKNLRFILVIMAFVLGIVPFAFAVEIEPILIEKASNNPDEIVKIVVDLKKDNEGIHDVLREATKDIDDEIEIIGADVRSKFISVKEEIGYYGNEEESLELLKNDDEEFISKLEDAQNKYGLDKSELKRLGDVVDNLRDKKTRIVSEILKNKYQGVQDSFVSSLKNNVDVIYQDFATNKVILEVRVGDILEISNIPEVHEIIYGEWPEIDELDSSVDTIGANTWHSNGLAGGSSEILFINSYGILTTHTALDHITWLSACLFVCPNGPENPSDDHDTLVAGIIGNNDATYGGVAPTIQSVYNAVTNNYATSVLAVKSFITDIFPASRAEFVLMSKAWGGIPPYCGDKVEEKYVDDVVDLFDVNWIKSAGNTAADVGYNGVTLPGGAYNIIAVGASNDKGDSDRSNDIIYYKSSLGPVEICGSGETRIKPDIVAPGEFIVSTSTSGFGLWSGTSFASPHVAASLVLIDQFPGLVPTARQSRALLLNTAEDRDEFMHTNGNDGPDNTWGYGYLDMDRAYLEADNNDDLTITGAGNNIFFNVPSVDQGDKATIVWNRHIVANNGVTNNLDLFLYDEVTGNLIDSSEYVGRNIEQVISDDNYAGGVIKVNLKTLNTGSAEDFGIAYNGLFNQINGPSFVSNLDIDSNLACGATTTITVDIINDGGVPLHNVIVTVNLPPEFTLVSGSNPQNVGTIDSGSNAFHVWTVKVSGAEDATFDVDVISDSYGVSYASNIEGNTYIGTQEVCFDGIDNDCDGFKDEGCFVPPFGGFLYNLRHKECKIGSPSC